MALAPIIQVKGSGVHVPGDAIDTDRIIPARFMKCVTFDGLGKFLFHDVRWHEDGSRRAHPLNDPRFKDATILLSGSNFGCGSSREHAPQALYRHGIRAIIAESFADIFFGNCTTIGMPCICLQKTDILALAACLEAQPDMQLTLDIESSQVRCGDRVFTATIRESARSALVSGQWDPIGELLEGLEGVRAIASKLPYMAPQ